MIGKKINQLATELAPASTDLTIIGNPTTGVSKKITLAQLGAIFSGAVSFYTNYAAFPTPGTTDVIFCAKDTQKLYLWSGSAYVEVFPSQALLDTYQLRSEKGVSNGYASLDSSGKVPISQLPSSIMEYKGTWNAATNTPTLANGTGDTGDVYICNVAGTVNFGAGPITFAVGDYTIYSGSIWQRSSGAVGTVTSVAASITGDAIGITGSPVTTSGTLAFAFGGNSTQYINGAGNLVTFPGIINEAQNLITEVYNKTGATLTKGTVVYINGGQGNLPSVTKALATGDSTSAQTYGIVRNDITNNNNGYVVVAGRISDLDTQAYTEGTQLYLSPTTAGTYTSTKPYAPNHLVYVGIVVRAHPTQGVIEVKIQNGYELDELHNVSAQSPTNNDGIFYNSATSLWEKKSIATVLGYTPQAQLNGTGFVKASGTTISYDNSTYVTTDTFQTISASKTFGVGFSIASAGGTNQLTSFLNTNSIHSGSAGTNVFGFNNSNNIYFGKGLSNGGVITYNNSAVRFYALPDADGTIALVGGSGVGTVTSVGLSSATSGVTIGSTPITTSGTITLAIATASGSQQGLLSSTDWTTFNNKQSALTNPVTGTGTTNYIPKFTATSTIGNSLVYDDGTNVGIGTATPSARLDLGNNVGSANTANQISLYGGGLYGFGVSAAQLNYISGGSHSFYNTATSFVQMLLTTSGNLGLGVTPSAWASGFRALQMTSGVALISHPTVPIAYLSANYLATDSGAVYISSNFASRFLVNGYSGGFSWDIAPSGTAGNAISFTQAMTLNASGNLSVGNTNDTYKLDVSGTAAVSSLIVGGASTLTGRVQGTEIGVTRDGADTIGDGPWFRWTNAATTRQMLTQLNASNGLTTWAYNGSAWSSIYTLTQTGAATFSSSVTAAYLDITSSASSLAVFNSTDTNGGYIRFKRSGTDFGFMGSAYHLFFGTQSNNDLGIRSDGNLIISSGGAGEKMRLTSAGNLGIGTTSPSLATLQVVRAGAGQGDGNGAIMARASDGDQNWVSIGNFSTAGSSYGWIQASSNAAYKNLILNPSGGNVGIGTASPTSKLSVFSDGATIPRIGRFVQSNSGTSSVGALQAVNAAYTGSAFDAGHWTSSSTNWIIRAYNNVSRAENGDVNGSGSSFVFGVRADGNVEINTGSIKTGEPDTGYGRAAFKIGSRQSGSATGTGGYIPISIDGTVYFINLYTSTP
jgi:hypothetical protein